MVYYSFVFLIFAFLGIEFSGNLMTTFENNFTNRLKPYSFIDR